MEALRRLVSTIQKFIGRMTLTQRLLILSLGVIVAMTLFIVVQYAGQPDGVLLEGVTPSVETVSALQAAGIEPEVRPDGLYVPAGQRVYAIAELGQSGGLPDDTVVLFNNLGAKQDWRFSREQNRQQFVFALQNELSRVLTKFRGVKSAAVILDIPEAAGLGRAAREPSASVTIVTNGGPMPQGQVDAAAALVAGAVAGLAPERVEVIDALAGRTRRAQSSDDVVAATYMEHRSNVERQFRERLETHLGYIPGVMVAVTADVDVTRLSQQTKRHLEKGQGTVSLPRKDMSETLSETNAIAAAEPGIRSNQGADINSGGGGTGSSTEQAQGETEFDNAIGTVVQELLDPRGAPTYLAVSVNVPEGFVSELLKREAPAAGAGGGDDAAADVVTREKLDERFTALRGQIEASLRPLIKTRGADGSLVDGEVTVAMVPVDMPGGGATQAAGFMGLFADGPGGGLLGGGGALDTIVVGASALVALSLMLMLVRRSGKKLELPTAEELVGVPPSLGLDEFVIGEAGEGDSPMQAIEVGEDDMRRQKMLTQVQEMLTADPSKVAKLMSRWMAVEE